MKLIDDKEHGGSNTQPRIMSMKYCIMKLANMNIVAMIPNIMKLMIIQMVAMIFNTMSMKRHKIDDNKHGHGGNDTQHHVNDETS